jgi:hypothetical protein
MATVAGSGIMRTVPPAPHDPDAHIVCGWIDLQPALDFIVSRVVFVHFLA